MILPSIVFVLLGVVVLCAVLVYKMSLHAVESAQRAHERSNEYNQDLLNRLMAMDFNTYKAYERDRDTDTGYVPPEPLQEVPVGDGRHGGFASSLGLRGLSGGGGDE